MLAVLLALFLAVATHATAQVQQPPAGALPRGTFSVLAYGAKCDGTTNDTAAIQAAIVAAETAGGGIVLLPNGVCRIADAGAGYALRILQYTITLAGAGPFASLLKMSGSNDGLVVSGQLVILRDFGLHGNTTGRDGLVLHNAGGARLTNVYATQWSRDGISFQPLYTTPAGNDNAILLTGVVSSQNTRWGIAAPVEHGDLNNIELHSAYVTSNTGGGLLIKGQGWNVVGGIYESNGGYGIQIGEASDTIFHSGSTITHPWLESNATGGYRGTAFSARNLVWQNGVSGGQMGCTAASGFSLEAANVGYDGCVVHDVTSRFNFDVQSHLTIHRNLYVEGDALVGAGHLTAFPQGMLWLSPYGSGANVSSAASVRVQGAIGTGTGTPGTITLLTGALGTPSGTTNHTPVERTIIGATKILTNNSVVSVVSAPLANNSMIGGILDYTIEVTNGTDYQAETGSVRYAAVNKGGAVTRTVTEDASTTQALSAGTLASSWAMTAADPAVLTLNANSSLTPSAGYPRITYHIRNHGQQAITPQ